MKKTIQLKIRTPLWTGDIDSKSDLLQSSGIIGSLRWWMEAILRGMGKFACDPVGDDRCPKEKKADSKKINLYCPACLIFGATGTRRLFRIELNGGRKVFDGGSLNIRPDGRNRGWYLGSGLVGDIELNIVPLDNSFNENLILLPLTIAAKWGGIGAKTQHGYGVVETVNGLNIDFGEFSNSIESISNNQRLTALGFELRTGNNDGLSNLKQMFFAKVWFEADEDWWKRVDGIRPDNQRNYRGYVNDQRMIQWIESNSVPIAPTIKNWLRFGNGQNLWKTNDQNKNRKIENWLFGITERVCAVCYEKVKEDRNNPQNFWCKNCRKSLKKEETFERIASKINISCAYPVNDNLWEFRIWGWIPNGRAEFDRNGFLKNLKDALNGSGSPAVPWKQLLGDQTNNHKLKVWREFDSSRDTVKQESDVNNNYIKSLLEGEK